MNVVNSAAKFDQTNDPFSEMQMSTHVPLKVESVGLIFNPISGQGRSKKITEAIAKELGSNQIQCELIESRRNYEGSSLLDELKRQDVVIVVGGDGTMAGLLPYLAESQVPVYMAPAGNESLFARGFSMRRDAADIAAAFRQGLVEEHSFGLANNLPFFTMVSVGIDSLIVHDVHANRTGPVGNIGYVWPAVKNFLSYQPPKITLEVDGERVLEGEAGYLIIANSPQYALGLNLVPEADSRKLELSARFIPSETAVHLISLATARYCGFQAALSGSHYWAGKHFSISSEGSPDYPVQADGEAFGKLPTTVSLGANRLRILQGIKV